MYNWNVWPVLVQPSDRRWGFGAAEAHVHLERDLFVNNLLIIVNNYSYLLIIFNKLPIIANTLLIIVLLLIIVNNY